VFGLRPQPLPVSPGWMQAPILTVQIGMGENILILAFVIHRDRRNRLLSAARSWPRFFVGIIDALGRAFLPDLLRQILSSTAASTAAPAPPRC